METSSTKLKTSSHSARPAVRDPQSAMHGPSGTASTGDTTVPMIRHSFTWDENLCTMEGVPRDLGNGRFELSLTKTAGQPCQGSALIASQAYGPRGIFCASVTRPAIQPGAVVGDHF